MGRERSLGGRGGDVMDNGVSKCSRFIDCGVPIGLETTTGGGAGSSIGGGGRLLRDFFEGAWEAMVKGRRELGYSSKWL